MAQYMTRAITPATINKTTATVTAAFMPDAKSLVQIIERSIITRTKNKIQIMDPFFCRFAHAEILSWLNATRMKGIDTAPEMLTVTILVTITYTKFLFILSLRKIRTHIFQHIAHRKLPIIVERECINANCKESSYK